MDESMAADLNARAAAYARAAQLSCTEMLGHLASLRALFSDLRASPELLAPDDPQHLTHQTFLEEIDTFTDYVHREMSDLFEDDTEEWFRTQGIDEK